MQRQYAIRRLKVNRQLHGHLHATNTPRPGLYRLMSIQIQQTRAGSVGLPAGSMLRIFRLTPSSSISLPLQPLAYTRTSWERVMMPRSQTRHRIPFFARHNAMQLMQSDHEMP